MYVFKAIRTIKEGEIEKNIKLVWYTTSSQDDVKNILAKYSIVVLSFSDYNESFRTKMYEVGITANDTFIDIIFPIKSGTWKIRDAFNDFMNDFWILNIDYIKPYWVELSEEKKKLVLNKLLEEYQGNKAETKSKEKKDQGKISELEWKQIALLKKDIEEFIVEMKDLIKKAESVDPSLSFELNNMINELQKYKKITNIYKIADVYKKALELSERLYDKYYDYLKEQEIKSSKDQIITEIDIVAEYKNYMKVQRAKTLEKVDAKEFWFPWYEVIYYKIFGRLWVDLKLLIREFIKKYQLDYFSFDDFLNFFQLLFIFLIINYSLILLYKSFTNAPISDILAIHYLILNFAIFGFIVTVWKLIKNRFISIVVMIVLIIISIYLKKYFAL